MTLLAAVPPAYLAVTVPLHGASAQLSARLTRLPARLSFVVRRVSAGFLTTGAGMITGAAELIGTVSKAAGAVGVGGVRALAGAGLAVDVQLEPAATRSAR